MNNWLLCLPGLASAVVIREDTMVRERRTKSHFAIVTDLQDKLQTDSGTE